MTAPIPINLAVEDTLSEAAIRRLLSESGKDFVIGRCYQQSGNIYLKRNIGGFNNAAKGTPFLVLTDLDADECAPLLIANWLSEPKHPNLLFRIAVHEVEAWLLADGPSLAEFFRIRKNSIRQDVDPYRESKGVLGLAGKEIQIPKSAG